MRIKRIKLPVSQADRGFTLIELMTTVAIASIILAGFYTAFVSQRQAFTVQDSVSRTQGNLRVAMGMIERDIRMAGLGLQDQNNRQAFDVNSGGAASADALTIWANFQDEKLFTTAGLASGATIISVGVDPLTAGTAGEKKAPDFFKAGDWAMLHDFATNNNEARLITNVTNTQITVTPGITLPFAAGSQVSDIEERTYSLAVDGDGHQNLYLTMVNTAGTRGAHLLAGDIEDLQLEYGMDNTADGQPDSWVVNPLTDGFDNDQDTFTDSLDVDGSDLTRVTAIRVSILARTEQEDKSWERGGKTPPYHRPQIEDRVAAGTYDGFRRRLSTKTVFVRNQGLVWK